MPVERQLNVQLVDHAYPITIGRGMLRELGDVVRGVAPHAQVLLVVDAAIPEHGVVARQSLDAAGYRVSQMEMTALESNKTLGTVESIYTFMLAEGLQRSSPVVAVGGGIVGDTAGFAAATYHRGVPLIQVPTTLLAMVDASIGGKTGVNHSLPEGRGLGKNLFGSFWQPRAVLIDPDVLNTLEDRHLRCGLAESIKHGILGDVPLFEFIEANVAAIADRDMDVVTELVARSAGVKVEIVQRDVMESGPRAYLNLGHTFAHSIEADAAFDLHHGEAVAVGLCAAAFVAAESGRITSAELVRIEQLIDRVGLPTRLASAGNAVVDTDKLIALMAFDKKADGSRIHLVLPNGIGAAEVTDACDIGLVGRAWQHVTTGSVVSQ